MGLKIGSNYFGCSSLQTSTANVEIIQQHKPVGYSDTFEAYKFSFLNNSACTIKINGSSPIYISANQGFNNEYYDAPIYSFVVVTAGIQYNYIGAY